ncbi:MAG TPA: hypothetical protein VF046_13725 [Gemmatimonadales bacterium]
MRISAESTTQSDAIDGTPLQQVLSPLHEAWITEARWFLDPASHASAPFWDRWSVVRYLNDQFPARFDLQRILVRELRPSLEPRHIEAIDGGAERLTRLRLALDRIGRRRGTAAEFAPIVEEFLAALELWCAEVELAVRNLDRGQLSQEGRQVLTLIESTTSPAI